MKKIPLSLLLIFLLLSCGKTNFEQENIINYKQYDDNLEEDIQENLDDNLEEDNLENNTLVTESINKINSWYENISNYSSDELLNFSCDGYFPKDGNFIKQFKTQEELKTLDDVRNKCYKLVENANNKLKEYNNKIENFGLNDCEKSVKENNKDLDSDFLNEIIDKCKIGFAINKGNCGLIKDENLNLKCISIKKDIEEYLRMQSNYNIYGEFNYDNYVK